MLIPRAYSWGSDSAGLGSGQGTCVLKKFSYSSDVQFGGEIEAQREELIFLKCDRLDG